MKKNQIIFNDLVQYNLWEGELSGQLSDGKWENYRPAGAWWHLEAVYDPNAAESHLQLYHSYYSYNRCVNVASRDLINVVGDRMRAYIAAGLVGIRVSYNNDSSVEKMYNYVEEGLDAETALARMKKEDSDEMLKSGRNSYWGFDRLSMTEADFLAAYEKLRHQHVDNRKVYAVMCEIKAAMKNQIRG